MENFIAKLKTVDKKVWVGVGIGTAVLIILIIALIIGLSNNKKPTGGNNNSQNETQYGTETESGVTEESGSEGLGTEVTGTEITTETEMGTETETTESESESQTQGNGGTVTQNPDVNGVTQKPTTDDGTTGMGTASMPYDIIPDGNTMKFTTYSIPANGSAHYNIMKTVGKYFIIEDADAYVVYNGKRHDAKNGRVFFLVTDSKALPTDYLSFEIGNKSAKEKIFTVRLSDPTGTQDNPETISENGPFTTNLKADDTQGYYYSYKVVKKSAIRFYITSETSKCSLTVTRVRNDIPVQKTFQADVLEDEKGRYVEFSVEQIEVGDEVTIIVSAEKYRGKIPAADVTWEIVYVE